MASRRRQSLFQFLISCGWLSPPSVYIAIPIPPPSPSGSFTLFSHFFCAVCHLSPNGLQLKPPMASSSRRSAIKINLPYSDIPHFQQPPGPAQFYSNFFLPQ